MWLQRVLNAAARLLQPARLVSGTRKFDRGLSRLLHVDLHWLDVPERVQYKLGVTVRRCQQHKAPQYYLTDCVTPASDIASRQRQCALRLTVLCVRFVESRCRLGSRDKEICIICIFEDMVPAVIDSRHRFVRSCIAPHACMDLHEFFKPKVDFILEVISIDLHCHLEVTVAQQVISA